MFFINYLLAPPDIGAAVATNGNPTIVVALIGTRSTIMGWHMKGTRTTGKPLRGLEAHRARKRLLEQRHITWNNTTGHSFYILLFVSL
jgi:hypothetical protein